jgi:hypothetical protein
MEVKWLQSLREYLRHIGASLQLDSSYIPSLERVHDHHIMDVIIQSAKFTPKEIKTLNYCRMYLQAVTLSDITNAAGNALDMHMLAGNVEHISSISTWHHFHQQRPYEEAWELWREANKLWSKADGKLHQPLTKWLTPPSRQRRNMASVCRSRTASVTRLQTTLTIPSNADNIEYADGKHQLWDIPNYSEDTANAEGLVPYTTELPDSAIPITVKS